MIVTTRSVQLSAIVIFTTFPKRRESWDCKCSSFNKVKTNLFLCKGNFSNIP